MKLAPGQKILAAMTLLAALAVAAPARAITAGQNPLCITWRAITTPHFRVIYPADIEKDAQRVAATLEHAYPHVAKTLRYMPKRRLPVLLFTRSAQSNGYASLMPRRSQWWNTPPQGTFAGTNDWYTELAIHEFRHIVQMDGLNRGFNTAMYILFGEAGLSAAEGLSVPTWFLEGDAVGTETALTSSGRGRIPEFDVELRALLLSGKRYKYFKAMFGSYRDWDPLFSPYLMGYYLTTHVKRKWGPDVWAEVMKRSTWCPFVPHWFDFMLITRTGSSGYSIYNETMDEMERLWRGQLAGISFTDTKLLHKTDPKFWTYNNAPQYAPDGSIIILRYGMKDIYTLMKIDPATGKETRLCYPGKINFAAPSAGGSRIVWSETMPDLRWGQQSFSVIVSYDTMKKKKKFITRKTRLFAPALSPDGKKIAAVEFTIVNECALVIVDAESGAELARFPSAENEFIQTPHWSLDGKSIVYTKTHRLKGKTITIFNAETGASSDLVPYSALNIYYPVSDGTHVFFVSPHSGIDNIYAVNIRSKKIYQVTSRKFGAYYPALSPDGARLAFNDVTAEGYTAVEMPLDQSRWIPIEKVEDRSIRYHEPLIGQEAGGDITKDIPPGAYESKKFYDIASLVVPHSWLPMADPFSNELSLTLSSRNLLGTAEASAGYVYNWNENTHGGLLSISYAGLYPVLDASVFYGGRSSTYEIKKYYGLLSKTFSYTWRELRPSLGITLPFNFTCSRFDTQLSVGVRGSYILAHGMNAPAVYYTPDRYHNGRFIPLTYFASLYNGYRGFADINPVWGQSVSIVYRHTPFNGKEYGSIFSTSGTLWFPGILRHHSLFFQGGYEYQNAHEYRFPSQMRFARGYEYEFARSTWKACANYMFPLFDPDWNLVHVLHFKRFYANIFGDYAMQQKEYFRSVGLELYAEIRLYTIETPLVLGVRGYYRFDQHDAYKWPYGFDFLFGISSSSSDLAQPNRYL